MFCQGNETSLALNPKYVCSICFRFLTGRNCQKWSYYLHLHFQFDISPQTLKFFYQTLMQLFFSLDFFVKQMMSLYLFVGKLIIKNCRKKQKFWKFSLILKYWFKSFQRGFFIWWLTIGRKTPNWNCSIFLNQRTFHDRRKISKSATAVDILSINKFIFWS